MYIIYIYRTKARISCQVQLTATQKHTSEKG